MGLGNLEILKKSRHRPENLEMWQNPWLSLGKCFMALAASTDLLKLKLAIYWSDVRI